MWRGTGSLPPGVAVCRKCRAERTGPKAPGGGVAPRQLVERSCAQCGAVVLRKASEADRWPRSFCGAQCRSEFAGKSRRTADYSTRRAADRMRCARRRARKSSAIVEAVDPDRVLKRDGWRCHICHRKIDRNLSGRHRMGPTIDHLVPLSEGGEHSYANVAAAHRSCNSKRGTRGAAQLALVG